MTLPGQTIGILGGGQLGRMFAIAARRMGYRVHALDPSLDCPAGQVADVEINRRYDDLDAARNFAAHVDVVTFEFENVPAETLEAIEGITPVRPSPFVLDTCRHRLREKTFLSGHGFPVADFRECRDAADVRAASAALGGRGILKSAEFGYDGKGQSRLASPADADAAWSAVGVPVAVFERFVDFDLELSVLVARTASGETRCFAPGRNDHAGGILDVTTVPAGLPPGMERDATDLAVQIADALDVVGLLAVELFATRGGLVVNELAPRPHNSGHWTFDAAVTSQFEQQLRAVCGLPLGDPSPLAPACAMANLLGDLWRDAPDGRPDWPAALADPSVKLHLYGKTDPKPGRKMGHLTATAATPEAARAAVLGAREALSSRRPSGSATIASS